MLSVSILKSIFEFHTWIPSNPAALNFFFGKFRYFFIVNQEVFTAYRAFLILALLFLMKKPLSMSQITCMNSLAGLKKLALGSQANTTAVQFAKNEKIVQ